MGNFLAYSLPWMNLTTSLNSIASGGNSDHGYPAPLQTGNRSAARRLSRMPHACCHPEPGRCLRIGQPSLQGAVRCRGALGPRRRKPSRAGSHPGKSCSRHSNQRAARHPAPGSLRPCWRTPIPKPAGPPGPWCAVAHPPGLHHRAGNPGCSEGPGKLFSGRIRGSALPSHGSRSHWSRHLYRQ